MTLQDFEHIITLGRPPRPETMQRDQQEDTLRRIFEAS